MAHLLHGAGCAAPRRWRGHEWRLAESPLFALLPLLAVLPFVYGRHLPSQDVLVTIARHLADGLLHVRQELHRR